MRNLKLDGKPVNNATKPLLISITSKDARAGLKKDPMSCAAAVACTREIPNCTEARVHVSVAYLKIKGKWFRYRTPQALRTEIVGFDRGAKFSPGDYYLAPIQPSHRANGKRMGGSKPTERKGPKQKRHQPHRTGVRAIANYK